jgi:hypothetical protein
MMRVETRSALILLATLTLGIALGIVSSGRWRQLREVATQDLRRPAGFVQRLESIIQPRADQADSVRLVLEATARRNQQILDRAQRELRGELEAMRVRLAPLLDDAQRARLADESNFGNPLRPPPPRGARPRDGGRRRPPPPREDLPVPPSSQPRP